MPKIHKIWIENPEVETPPGITPEEGLSATTRMSARAVSNKLRLERLFEEGGIYIDHDFVLADPLPELPEHLVLHGKGFATNNCFLAAPPEDPALLWLLDNLACPWGQVAINQLLPYCPHPWSARLDVGVHKPAAPLNLANARKAADFLRTDPSLKPSGKIPRP